MVLLSLSELSQAATCLKNSSTGQPCLETGQPGFSKQDGGEIGGEVAWQTPQKQTATIKSSQFMLTYRV